MLLYISQPRFLIAFVSSFIFSYALGYQHLAHASLAPNYQFFSIHSSTITPAPIKELELIPVVKTIAPTEPVKTVDLSDYRTFPDPEGDGSYEAYQALFEFVADVTGVDVQILARMAALESSFQKDATPGGPDSAKGLFQFIDDTWAEAVTKHGAQFGIDHTVSAFDPKANTIMGAMWLKYNIELLERVVVDRSVTETDVYLTHFLGRTGAQRFLKAEPTKIAARYMPGPAKRNRNIFYSKDNKARSYEEVYVAINTRFEHKAIEFSLN